MRPVYNTGKVYSNIEITAGIFKMKVSGIYEGNPGQFYMIRAWGCEPLLNRPISIHHIDKEGITFLYQAIGKGTEEFANLKTGDSITLQGPHGNGFDIEGLNGKIALVAGGMGAAPLLYTAEKIKGCIVDLYAGFRDVVHTADSFEGFVDNIYISTESGSTGHKGYVTDILKPEDYNMVLCCGPEPMAKKVVEICKGKNTPVQVSMEKRMACGVGACLVCTCKTKFGNRRTCKDGPVFYGENLVF